MLTKCNRVALNEYLLPFFNGSIFLNLESQLPTSDSVQALWNGSADLDSWIKNLGTSMTNVVRANSPSSDPLYNGQAYQLGVNIRWEWLALPIAMVALSLLFLVIIIFETHNSPVAAWKGSPLALLFFDVDPETKGKISGQTHRFKGIERSVGRTKVVLKTGPGGKWMFKGV